MRPDARLTAKSAKPNAAMAAMKINGVAKGSFEGRILDMGLNILLNVVEFRVRYAH